MVKQGIGILILGSVFASGVAAALAIDQEQTDTRTVQSGVNSSSGKLQSFQSAVTNVAGGGFYFGRAYLNPIVVTIAVWDALPDVGSQIASGTAVLSTTGWLDAFWTPVPVIQGATYFLAVTTEVGPTSEPQVTSDNPLASYVNGRPYNFDPVTLAIDYIDPFYRDFDYSFRTYYEPATSGVPEPGTLALLGLGLAGLGLSRRRKAA